MCPVCIATAAIIAGSATGTGGLTAFVSRRILRRKSALDNSWSEKESEYGNRDDRNEDPEGGVAR
jgi:hypothetical protein